MGHVTSEFGTMYEQHFVTLDQNLLHFCEKGEFVNRVRRVYALLVTESTSNVFVERMELLAVRSCKPFRWYVSQILHEIQKST